MQLWKKVDETDPSHVKRVNAGRSFSSVDAHTQIQKATEVFGPCGIGWGIRDSIFQLIQVDPNDARYSLIAYTGILWFIWEGKEGLIDIAADIELFQDTRAGWRRIDDPYKKVRTDAVTKGLSWLGFNADVFFGRFDDNKYVSSEQNGHDTLAFDQRPYDGATQNTTSYQPEKSATEKQVSAIFAIAKVVGLDANKFSKENFSVPANQLSSLQASKLIDMLNAKKGDQ